MNPFKFGTIVGNEFFTDRVAELEEVKQMLDSENHLVIISPRRFGKSSLIAKALLQLQRPSITIDLMKVLSVEDFASQILRSIFKIYKMEKLKHIMSNFRITPNISYNPMNDSWSVNFPVSTNQHDILLEDAMGLLEKVSSSDNKLIIVLDEFQEINEIDKNLAKQLRAIMQRQQGLNYVFMGSQESMMNEIFEKKKSPFYHFGQRMNLKKIPYEDFMRYIMERLPDGEYSKEDVTSEILSFTKVHPYYTQQLASCVYNLIAYSNMSENIVVNAIRKQVEEHDLDYERLWLSMKRTDRKVLSMLANGVSPVSDRTTPTSTIFSSLQRLVKNGYVIRLSSYELEDPFFGEWIRRAF